MENLGYDEILSACVIQAKPTNDDETTVIAYKTDLFEKFKPLLKHYCAGKRLLVRNCTHCGSFTFKVRESKRSKPWIRITLIFTKKRNDASTH